MRGRRSAIRSLQNRCGLNWQLAHTGEFMSGGTSRSGIRVATPRVDSSLQPELGSRAQQLKDMIEEKTVLLLGHHPYFIRCRAKQIDRDQALNVVKHLYCFSVFFERLLARRVTEHSSMKDPRVLALARKHLQEEIGHAELFRECLEINGVAAEDVLELVPATFTKAMFGYLTVTIQYESEFVANVAIMQVMESIGCHFFAATLELLQSHGIVARAIAEHAAADIAHANMGLELIDRLDDGMMSDCRRIVSDVYRLMSFVLAEWLDVRTDVFVGQSGHAVAS
jgi:pyrroloquinoline quinone (PQQ) biosynthesis protein C